MTKYAIFGLGKSGLATADYLLAQGHEICAWDDGEAARESFSNSSSIIHPSDWNWTEISSLILAPGIPLTHPKPHAIVAAARENNVEIICDVELLWRDNPHAKFIGITGTNGKSTTTALLAHVLAECELDVAVGGNLGQAALTLGAHDFYVIEMSSYQLDLIQNTRFDVAIWLNTTPDHLDRHGDMAGYVAAKSRIFMNENDARIIGIDDETGKKLAQDFAPATSISGEDALPDFPNLPGKHNKQNISADVETARVLGLGDEQIFSAISSFAGLAHRLEFVDEFNGIKFVNDSKATNAESAIHALSAYDNIFWLAGGVAKAGGIESLQASFPRIKKAYLFGRCAAEFTATLEAKVEYKIFADLPSATKAAYADAKNQSGATILLSPATASFDQYKSFEARGDDFKKIVAGFKQ